MSDKGRKQEDRSSILKSSRGSAVPQLGATPVFVPHPTYIPSDTSHTHTHTLHLTTPHHFAMIRPPPTLTMAHLTMSNPLAGKRGGAPTFSNDMGPPIFMPSLNLGVPKPSTSGPTPKPKNSMTQSSMSSSLVSDILSNAPTPTPFQSLSPFHVGPVLRPAQPTYIPSHPPPNASMKSPFVSQQTASVSVAKPTPIPATTAQKMAPIKVPSAPITKLISGGQSRASSATPILKPTPKFVTTKAPSSRSIAASSPEGDSANSLTGHMVYAPPTHIAPAHIAVPTMPYLAGHQTLMPSHALATAGQQPSTLSKMLLAPSSQSGRSGKAHDASSAYLHSSALGGHISASQRAGSLTTVNPDIFLVRTLTQTAPTWATSGQPSSTSSYTDTRLERSPHPSACTVQQSTGMSAAYTHTTGSRDRTTADVASNLIIPVPGLSGKHIAQITNSTGIQQAGSPEGEPFRAGPIKSEYGQPQPMDHLPLAHQMAQTAGIQSPTSAGQLPNLHQSLKTAVSVPSLPQATHISTTGLATAVAGSTHPQLVGGALGHMTSPGQGNSSPRPRILRGGSRKVDNQVTASSPTSSPLISRDRVPLGGASKQGVGHVTTPTGSLPSDHLLFSSPTHLKRPLSPPPEGTHNHLGGSKAEQGDYLASPRKKPRKQNVVANDDQYASNVPDGVSLDLSTLSHRGEGERGSLPSMTTRSRTKAEEGGKNEEAPKELEFRYFAQLRQSPYPINGVYRVYHRAAHNHFKRHADIKHREEERVSAYDVANTKSSWQRATGWKIHHFQSQLDEMSKVEGEILSTMKRLHASVENLDQCATCDVNKDCFRDCKELVQANVDRSNRILSHMSETRTGMYKVLDHKPQVTELLKKFSNKSSNSSYFGSGSQKSRT